MRGKQSWMTFCGILLMLIVIGLVIYCRNYKYFNNLFEEKNKYSLTKEQVKNDIAKYVFIENNYNVPYIYTLYNKSGYTIDNVIITVELTRKNNYSNDKKNYKFNVESGYIKANTSVKVAFDDEYEKRYNESFNNGNYNFRLEKAYISHIKCSALDIK